MGIFKKRTNKEVVSETNLSKEVVELTDIQQDNQEWMLKFMQLIGRRNEVDVVVTYKGEPINSQRARKLRRRMIKQFKETGRINIEKILKK